MCIFVSLLYYTRRQHLETHKLICFMFLAKREGMTKWKLTIIGKRHNEIESHVANSTMRRITLQSQTVGSTANFDEVCTNLCERGVRHIRRIDALHLFA